MKFIFTIWFSFIVFYPCTGKHQTYRMFSPIISAQSFVPIKVFFTELILMSLIETNDSVKILILIFFKYHQVKTPDCIYTL